MSSRGTRPLASFTSLPQISRIFTSRPSNILVFNFTALDHSYLSFHSPRLISYLISLPYTIFIFHPTTLEHSRLQLHGPGIFASLFHCTRRYSSLTSRTQIILVFNFPALGCLFYKLHCPRPDSSFTARPQIVLNIKFTGLDLTHLSSTTLEHSRLQLHGHRLFASLFHCTRRYSSLTSQTQIILVFNFTALGYLYYTLHCPRPDSSFTERPQTIRVFKLMALNHNPFSLHVPKQFASLTSLFCGHISTHNNL